MYALIEAIFYSSVQFFLYIFNNILIASSLQYYDKDTWYKHQIFFFIMLLLLWWGIRKLNIFVYLIFIKTRLFGDNCQLWQLKNETRRSTPSVLSWIPRQERCLRVCTRWAYYYRWIISILLYDFLRNPINEIER